MSFCTAINCIDGRIQLPVISYLQERFDVEYVDILSEPGPNLLLARDVDSTAVDLLFKGLQISIDSHNSVGIAIVGHHDCLGNPSPREEQVLHLGEAVSVLRRRYSEQTIIALWVDEEWRVHELTL
ncbi:MAG: hypothetical protein GY721_11640 [Deltaproteobacteria bacterium]|nr:hypothetical protein [Deltaproteobacteria bacterium]